jgi:hypothetical protein
MIKRVHIILFTILFSSVSFAGQALSSKTIKNVIVNLTSGVHFQINEIMPNPDACANGSWYKIQSDSKYEKEALSILLSYQAQGKAITFYLSGCTAGYPNIGYIY